MATEDCTSSSNSTKAIPGFASIIRTSLKPGYWLKSNCSIVLVDSWGKFCIKRILFGAAADSCAPGFPKEACMSYTYQKFSEFTKLKSTIDCQTQIFKEYMHMYMHMQGTTHSHSKIGTCKELKSWK